MESLKITKPIVSVDWLQTNLEDENLLILDCTIPKATENKKPSNFNKKNQIKGTVFFDIKNTFSDVKAPFPNTILSPEKFEQKIQELGVNKNSIIICYDDIGVYSSPRVWWMFQLMGFTNVAVLNGGFPKWIDKNFAIETQQNNSRLKGDFKVDYQQKKIKFKEDILETINNENFLIADARSKGRFYGTETEPRKGVKGGHIPSSISLPFNEVIEDGVFKSKEKLKEIFNEVNPKNKPFIFSCGTGVTASILALSAEISENKNYAVYDGSWTEWGSTENLAIEI